MRYCTLKTHSIHIQLFIFLVVIMFYTTTIYSTFVKCWVNNHDPPNVMQTTIKSRQSQSTQYCTISSWPSYFKSYEKCQIENGINPLLGLRALDWSNMKPATTFKCTPRDPIVCYLGARHSNRGASKLWENPTLEEQLKNWPRPRPRRYYIF